MPQIQYRLSRLYPIYFLLIIIGILYRVTTVMWISDPMITSLYLVAYIANFILILGF